MKGGNNNQDTRMRAEKKGRHRGETRPSPLRAPEAGRVVLLPEGANDFRRKCSEYTGQARWLRLALVVIARSLT
jgi:hypothetical protein